jgi:MFS family permease
MPLAPNVWFFAAAMLVTPIGTSLLFPATSSLVSRFAPKTEVGQTLGLQQAFGGVARMVGPITAGALFQHAGMRSPFFVASALMALNPFLWPLSRHARGREESRVVAVARGRRPEEPGARVPAAGDGLSVLRRGASARPGARVELTAALEARRRGVVHWQPAYASLLVRFDALRRAPRG